MDSTLSVISSIFGIVTGALAIGISVWTYIHGLNRERNASTLTTLQAIREKYRSTKDLSDDEKKKYLTELEFFATGVNLKIYSCNVVDKMSGKRLIKEYNTWGSKFIDTRRKVSGTENAYCEYEALIKKLKKKRKL